jgi:hypothetical protein
MKHASTMMLLACAVLACAGDDDDGDGDEEGSPDMVGSVCAAPADCYPEIDHAEILGEVLCLDRVRAGYCTHECAEDTDCCAVEGECVTDFPQVCSPFESTGTNMCFLSCEADVVSGAGSPDEQSFCHDEVSSDFICRSSGGGSENRKVCVPGDCGVGAGCGDAVDCDPDLECVDDFDGGYCGQRGCAANADCPQDSVCIDVDGDSYCVKPCTTDGDCALCRGDDAPAVCTAEVVFVEAGTTGSVCLGDHD